MEHKLSTQVVTANCVDLLEGRVGITFFRDKCLEERNLDIENDER